MTEVPVELLCTALYDTFNDVPGLAQAQNYDSLTENWNNLPLLQIYPQSWITDVTSETDRTTFRAGVRSTDWLIHMDVITSQRNNLQAEIAKLLPIMAAFNARFAEQDIRPYFGLVVNNLPGIKAFRWEGQRVVFNRNENEQYTGFRIVVTLRVF